MGTRKVEQGAVGGRVATNIRTLREQRGGMTLDQLARRLAEVGRPILKSGLSKIEQGERRVDADDLVAIALALGVNPSRLLLPDAAEEEHVRLTDSVEAPAWAVWQWADGLAPLPTRGGDSDEPWNTPEQHEEFQRLARPGALRRTAQHPLMRAAATLAHSVRRVIWHATKAPDPNRGRSDLGLETTLAAARRNLSRVEQELDDVIDEEARP